ncbi:hypothetical protein ACFFRR_003098 [Megaselia abdita]
MLTENSGEKPLEMENNNTDELLKINYSDYFHKDNEAKENDGVVEDGRIEEFTTEAGQELSFLNSEPQDVSTPVVSQKRGRGRPKKSSKSKKLPVKMERFEREYSMAMDTSCEGGIENRTAPPIVLKFKLGLKPEASKDEGMILNVSEPIMKRGRGRPRKVKCSPEEKTFVDYSHDNSEGNQYRPRKPLFLSTTAEDGVDNNDSHLGEQDPNSSISEVKKRLRGRPRTNYLHVQRMWTPKTEKFRKHRTKKTTPDKPVVKGPRGRPRIHPLPDPNIVKVRGRPRESYDPEHIKLLLEKRQGKENSKKHNSGHRGRPTKIESLRLMLESRKLHASKFGNDSQTSTKCTTPDQESDDESELLEMESSQLTFPLSAMLDKIKSTRGGDNIENKENLLFVSSKALCDNRKLKEKLLERNDPVFREMKLKFKQELKNIQKLDVKAKQQQQQPVNPINNRIIKRRGPRGPYKKKNAAPEPEVPQRVPISQRLIAKREAAAAAAAARALEPPPEPKYRMGRKKIVPIYNNVYPSQLHQSQQYVTPTCTIELIPELPVESEPNYPSDLDRFMKANNLIYRRDPNPKILISKNPFDVEPTMSPTLIVSKNPFLSDNRSAQNKMLMNTKVSVNPQTGPKKRGRPRKYPLPDTLNHSLPTPVHASQSNGESANDFINLISSDEEDTNAGLNPLNYTYPIVENEPVGYDYDEETYDHNSFDNSYSLFSENNVSISLISDDEDGGQ